ncbi:MAG: type IV toxin-antitoxin system AbiEi family antitoxin domain-containing protein [Elusimicrobiota bacterium]|nr:type IV toxin-antitoxin system AbiEi family antitoxin domain-containing protein [Elusimicrobiota bacterium]
MLKKYAKELAALKKMPGVFKTRDVCRLKIHPRNLYAMVNMGLLEKISRGTYRLPGRPQENPDIVNVAIRAPKGVICLISALAYHGITTQIPREVYLAVARGAEMPRLEYPPIRIFRFSKEPLDSGIETHIIDGVPVRIYNPEKTLADCFKFRGKVGLDTSIEALKMYLRRKNKNLNKLIMYAKICRVENVLRPYLESLL